mgnify:CR=1 FL=1
MKWKDIRAASSEWSAAYECLQRESQYLKDHDLPDRSAFESLSDPLDGSCDSWDPSGSHDGNLREVLEWYDLDYEFTQRATDISTKHAFPLSTYDDYQDKSCFVSHPDNGAVVARAVVHNEGIIEDARMLTNRKVCRVDWSPLDAEGRARVYVCNADDTNCVVYRPFKVVSTVSVGYLDNTGEALFSPLSTPIEEKLASMRSVFASTNVLGTMPIYKEIKFQFDSKWWGDYQFMPVETDNNGWCNWWQNYHTRWSNEFFHGSNTLVCVSTTEVYEEQLYPLDDDKVRLLLQESLGQTQAYADAVSPYVDDTVDGRGCVAGSPPYGWEGAASVPDSGCRYYVFNEENENWQGSYPNWKVGGTKEDFDDFTRGLSVLDSNGQERNVTHFAGDATCYRLWGTQHSAYYSGIRKAQYCIQEFHDEHLESALPGTYEATPQFCDIPPGGGLGNAFLKPSRMDL